MTGITISRTATDWLILAVGMVKDLTVRMAGEVGACRKAGNSFHLEDELAPLHSFRESTYDLPERQPHAAPLA